MEAGGDLLVRAHKNYEHKREEETRFQSRGMGMGYWGGWWGGPWGWGAPMAWGWGNPFWMNQIPYNHVKRICRRTTHCQCI